MKKALPYILILLILVNLFAPFSVGVDKNNHPTIKKSVAEAGYMRIVVKQNKVTDKSISFTFEVNRTETVHHKMMYLVTDKPGTKMIDPAAIRASIQFGSAQINPKTMLLAAQGAKEVGIGKIDLGDETTDSGSFVLAPYPVTINGLNKATTYYIYYFGYNGDKEAGILEGEASITTTETGIVDEITKIIGDTSNDDGFMPSCGIGNSWFTSGTIPGCFAQLLYYTLFQPTSFLFGLAGQFFDFTFFYSVNDESYRSAFVIEGWGVVRDFVNIFFIFVLLWIAFSTILNIHGFKTKEMVINVVIIGLLINFSLFATQVIIYASNILARVFYNNEVLGAKNKDGTLKENKPGEPIGLSEAIVKKVEPQKLIIQGKDKVGITDKVSGRTSTASTTSGIGIGTFILITLLATAVNVVGFFVFLTVGMIFIARVIGLWISMIFVPLAFFSYTVPAMQSVDMIGWKKWWPETLKLAFLAPIFIFFMYLILKFLSMADIIGDADNKTGVAFVIAVLVPFAFIMILLNKAKSLATKFAGDIGTTVTKTAMAAGGIALGGAALGTAVLGRKVIGGTMARISQSDSSKILGDHKVKMREWKKAGSQGAPPPKPVKGQVINGKTYNPKMFTGLGASLNASQKRVEKTDHERAEIDAVKDKRYKGTEWDKLSGTQQGNVKADYIKDNKSKYKDDIEENLRNTGFAGTPYATYPPGTPIAKDAALTDDQRKHVTEKTEEATGKKFDESLKEATKSINGFTRAFTRSNTGSYDVRNLSQTKANKREGFFTKMSAGLIAGIAMGVRTGLKGAGINHGSGQNDLLKDIGHTITEALKNIKVNVKVEESHGKGGGGEHKTGAAPHH